MGYHPRIESKKLPSLSTIRSRNSELWLINNRRLEEAILGYTAKCCQRYSTKLFALAIEGNHLHSLARYPEANRASFQRDLNSFVARAVPRYVRNYPGGPLWARRYSSEFVPESEDIEEYFFYVVLQPVKDGLVDTISQYRGYNCFSDAINGRARKFKVVRWTEYRDRKRWDKRAKVTDFTDVVELKFERLPGYEHLSQAEYRRLMLEKLEQRRLKVLAAREKQEGKSYAPRAEALRRKVPGSRPFKTKKSTRFSHRPRVLCVCPKRRSYYVQWYFDIYWSYKQISKRYREGDSSVVFPEGTYKPPHFTCRSADPADAPLYY